MLDHPARPPSVESREYKDIASKQHRHGHGGSEYQKNKARPEIVQYNIIRFGAMLLG
jgi:hypothetical protein